MCVWYTNGCESLTKPCIPKRVRFYLFQYM
jgi:hypothetical protein